MLQRKIAFRYIFGKRNYNFITVITTLSIIGISVGVAALIVVMSLFNGFLELTERQILGFDPNLRILPKEGSTFSVDSLKLDEIQSLNEVISTTSVIKDKVIAMNSGNTNVLSLLGYGNLSDEGLEKVSNSIIVGTFNIGQNQTPYTVIGVGLADRLGLLPGDTLSLISPAMIERSLRTFRASGPTKFIISGIFKTNVKDYDETIAITNFVSAGNLLKIEPKLANFIDIRTQSRYPNEKEINQIKKLIPNGFQLISWREINSELYQVMRLERLAAFALLSLIIIIAGFNLLASLSMTVVEKQRDIGALRAFGASQKFIRNIFIYEGLVIGIISTVLGTALGLAATYSQIEYKIFALDGNKYIVDALPMIVNSQDIYLIIIFTFALTFLSTLYPSLRASKTNISIAVKSE